MDINTAQTEACFQGLLALLLANYPAQRDETMLAAIEANYRRAVEKAAWLTPALLDATVEWVIEHVEYPLPTVAEFLAYARDVVEQQRRTAAPAPPAPLLAPLASARFDQAAFARQVAIGMLLQRRRQTAIVAWRAAQRAADSIFPKYGPVPRDLHVPPLTEPEIAAVVAELQTRQVARGRRRGSVLERAADAVLDALAAGGRVPAANGRGAL